MGQEQVLLGYRAHRCLIYFECFLILLYFVRFSKFIIAWHDMASQNIQWILKVIKITLAGSLGVRSDIFEFTLERQKSVFYPNEMVWCHDIISFSKEPACDGTCNIKPWFLLNFVDFCRLENIQWLHTNCHNIFQNCLLMKGKLQEMFQVTKKRKKEVSLQ